MAALKGSKTEGNLQAALRQPSTASLATVWTLKARRLSITSTLARVSFPWPKLCSRLYLLFFRMLNVSFSIFQRARPQAARSAVTSRSVTTLLKYVRFPFAFWISMENQFTASASSVSRNGTPESQR